MVGVPTSVDVEWDVIKSVFWSVPPKAQLVTMSPPQEMVPSAVPPAGLKTASPVSVPTYTLPAASTHMLSASVALANDVLLLRDPSAAFRFSTGSKPEYGATTSDG